LLFEIPCLSISCIAGLEAAWNSTIGRLSHRVSEIAVAAVAVVAIATVLALAPVASFWQIAEGEDIDDGMRYLKTQVGPNDLLFVHASMEETAKLYVRMFHW